jgi:hypothetical protein
VVDPLQAPGCAAREQEPGQDPGESANDTNREDRLEADCACRDREDDPQERQQQRAADAVAEEERGLGAVVAGGAEQVPELALVLGPQTLHRQLAQRLGAPVR